MSLPAPKHLSKASKSLWRRIVNDYELEHEAHALATLRLGLEALDRCDQARQAIAAHGITYEDRFGQPHTRPEVGIERDGRLAAVRCFRELSLDGTTADVQPPRIGTGRPS